MIRVDIETIIMAAGPVPSVIVLRERDDDRGPHSPRRALSIQTGSFEAAAVGRGIEHPESQRPVTHDLLLDTIERLGGKVKRVEINRVDAPVFFSSMVLDCSENGEISIDARPSDALAVAVRSNAPIYVEDDVMNRAGKTAPRADVDNEEEIARFDQFVQTLSPDDF